MVGTLFIIEALKEGFIGILLTLDTIIYWLIAGAFKIFMAIAGARLLSSSAYSEIANKIYIIVGVVMLFVLSYAILRGIIDPDKESKGEFGSKMLGRIVTAVVGLAIAPFLFNFMYQIQGKILEDDIIGKLFFRIESKDKYDLSGTVDVDGTTVSYGDTNTNPDEYVKSIGGAVTAVNLWQAFFFPSEDSGKTAAEIEADAGDYFASAAGYGVLCAGGIAAGAAASSIPVVGWLVGPVLMIGTALTACLSAVNDVNAGIQVSQHTDGKVTLEEAYEIASGTGEFSIFTAFIKNYADEGEITYLFLISTVAGAFALYAFVSFSIDMGIRAAMLAYLQIIAPIPLILQVLPKFKDNLHKYIGKVIGTFMEVFVRISVVYVVVYIICHLTELFGSVSTWQQENGLSPVQQVLALALLILGLIAFCRKAPEIISETLNLPKGNMNLGIGKKLADGGFYSGRSIASGGIKSAVNAWNDARPRNGASKPTVGQRAGAALAGFGLGTARAVHSNFIGPDHKEAKTAKEARALSERTAESVGTTLQNQYDRRDRHDRYDEQAEQFYRDMEAARNEMNNTALPQAVRDDARRRYEQALKDYREARAKARENTIVGAAITDLENRTKAWAAGTVDTSKEEATIKFGNSLDALKGSLREEAYKKDHNGGAATLKQQYDALKAQPINEYAQGWDEQSANAEYRRRRSELNAVAANAGVSTAQTAYNTSKADLDAAEANLNTVRSNTASTAAQIAAAEAAVTAAQHNNEAALIALNNALHDPAAGGLSQEIKYVIDDHGQLAIDMSDIKIDPGQAMVERDAQLEGLRIAMEAAADAWVHSEAQKLDSNTFRDIQKFLSDNASYIANNSGTQIVVDYKNGVPQYKALADVLEEGFGAGAVEGKFNPNDAFKSQNAFEFEMSNNDKITYTFNSTTNLYEGTDEQGHPTGTTYTKEDMIRAIREGVASGKVKKASSKTAVSKAADTGKTAARHVSNNEYAEKIQRKRQQQDAKK